MFGEGIFHGKNIRVIRLKPKHSIFMTPMICNHIKICIDACFGKYHLELS